MKRQPLLYKMTGARILTDEEERGVGHITSSSINRCTDTRADSLYTLAGGAIFFAPGNARLVVVGAAIIGLITYSALHH